MQTVLYSWLWLQAAVAAPPGPAGPLVPPGRTANPPDVVLVAPNEFLPAMRPWIEHRTMQGHRILHVPNTLSAEEIRDRIRGAARGGALRFIVLVGDADPAADDDAELRRRTIPTHLAEARVNVRWGSEPELATDNWYADLDDDRLPDVAVGRLTADSPSELTRIVNKILAYERSAEFGDWRQRINLVAGVGGFGPLIDPVLETATTKFLTDGIPASFDTSMTYGSWRSPYCPDPRKFHDRVVDRLNEGCLFWVYIGHGSRTFLDYVQTPGGRHHIFANSDTDKLLCNTPPIAVFLACYTGAFDYSRDCLAEELLRADGGPIAIYSGSRVTMPYAMAVMGTSLMDECFQQRRPTLGEVILHAKRRMAIEVELPKPAGASNAAGRPPGSTAVVDPLKSGGAKSPAASDEPNPIAPLGPEALARRRLLDALAAAISPAPDLLAEERMEHVELFNLIGDPLLRLQHAAPIQISAQSSVPAGESLPILCRSDQAGRCTVELVCRRDRTRVLPPKRSEFLASSAWLESFDQVYEQSNDRRWTVQELDASAGEFQLNLAIPAEARGACHIRVRLRGDQSFAAGSTDIYVKRPSAEAD